MALNLSSLISSSSEKYQFLNFGSFRVTIKSIKNLPTAVVYMLLAYLGVRAMTYDDDVEALRTDLSTTLNALISTYAGQLNTGLDPEAFTFLGAFSVARSRITKPVVDWILGEAANDVPTESQLGSAALAIALGVGVLYMIDIERV